MQLCTQNYKFSTTANAGVKLADKHKYLSNRVCFFLTIPVFSCFFTFCRCVCLIFCIFKSKMEREISCMHVFVTHIAPLTKVFGSIPLKLLVPFVSNHWWAATWQTPLCNIHMMALHPLRPVATIAPMHKPRTLQEERGSGNNWSLLFKERKILRSTTGERERYKTVGRRSRQMYTLVTLLQ